MALPLSEYEQEAFAAIVSQLGHPERRRLARLTMGLGGAVLVSAFTLMVLLLHWEWTIFASFATTFVIGTGFGWAFIARHPLD